jgi:hypothetical protein
MPLSAAEHTWQEVIGREGKLKSDGVAVTEWSAQHRSGIHVSPNTPEWSAAAAGSLLWSQSVWSVAPVRVCATVSGLFDVIALAPARAACMP